MNYPSASMVKGPRLLRRRRSTYSINNAVKFRPIFDEAIKSRQDIIIPFEGNPDTFHIKCSDALKWLIDNWDKEEYLHLRDENHKPKIYLQFRSEIRLRNTSEGLMILWNHSPIVPHYYKVGEPSNGETKEGGWKDKLFTFLESKDTTLKLEGLYLSQEDIDWTTSTLGSLSGVVFEVTTNKLIVAKDL